MGRAVTGRPQSPYIRRDCTHTRKHEHGTTLAYKEDDCRCAECRYAMAEDYRVRARLKAYGRYPQQQIHAAGARRRLQALATLGWGFRELAKQAGTTHPRKIQHIRAGHGQWVTPETHAVIVALYDRLWSTPAPERSSHERSAVKRSKDHARAKGWLPPLAWDDDEIDNPDALPAHSGPRLTGCARDRYLDLVELGCTLSEIALKYGVNVESVARTLQRAETAA
jgi:hypothetical protein